MAAKKVSVKNKGPRRQKAYVNGAGFTLMELLLALFVIGILSIIVVLNLMSANGKARNARRLNDINQIASAIQLYRYEHNGNPPGEDGVEYINGSPIWIPDLVPQYLHTVPSDPIDSNEYKYHYIRDGVNYEVSAFMEANGDDASCGDGGPGGCDYYENSPGEFLTIYNPGASGWNFTSASYVPQSALMVLSPSGGEKWVQGFKGQVFWNASATSFITVNLYKNGSFYRTLVSNAPATRFSGYNFQNLYPNAYYTLVPIPADLPLGNDYKIEVLDSNDLSLNGMSNAAFSVIPLYSHVTLSGRFIDAFTLEPIVGAGMIAGSSTVYTNSNGAFSFSATISDISENASKNLFASWPSCHMPQGAGFFNYYTAIYAAFNPFDLMANGTNMPIYSSSIDLGDIKLWPAVDISIHSDIPVQYTIEYPEERTSVGNTGFLATQGGFNVIPLDYDLRVKLTDQSGNVYTSPSIRLPSDWGCVPKTLNFSGGNFTWQ